MAVRTVHPEPIAERASLRYQTSLKKETGAVLPASELTTLTLTLYALDAARTILNSVNAVSILNTGRGTVGEDGVLVVVLTPADNAILDPTLADEKHVMLLQGTYSAGTKETRHEVLLTVLNLTKVP